MLHELYFVSTGQYRADEGYPLMVYLMPRLLGTGRCVLDPYDRECLHLGPTRPVRLQWILAEDATQRPRLVPGDDTPERMTVLALLPPWYLDGTACGPLAMGIDGVMLATLLQAPPLTPAAARAVRERLLQTEPALQEALPLAPEAGPAISIVPVLCLYLTREPVERRRAHGGVPEVPLARLRFAYGPVQVAISAPDETIFAVADGQALAYRRHLETEQRALVTLRQAGLFPPPLARGSRNCGRARPRAMTGSSTEIASPCRRVPVLPDSFWKRSSPCASVGGRSVSTPAFRSKRSWTSVPGMPRFPAGRWPGRKAPAERMRERACGRRLVQHGTRSGDRWRAGQPVAAAGEGAAGRGDTYRRAGGGTRDRSCACAARGWPRLLLVPAPRLRSILTMLVDV